MLTSIPGGTRLGSYEITAPIAASGMSEVYRARDTRLDRTVALKVLPAHLAENPESRERFEREARAVSSLNHPHVCVLHDIGRQDGVDFLVMEYVEGETLARRLAAGPLPLEQALEYAIQIAGALAGAHRRGICHRDLKPGNIMLTKAGTKLLDFGLAKFYEPGSVAAGASVLATATDVLMQKGTILGTFQYMAPEQLDGRETDARTGKHFIRIYDQRGLSWRLTSSGTDEFPTWSPDGKKITYLTGAGSGSAVSINEIPAEASSPPQVLLSGGMMVPNDWSPSGDLGLMDFRHGLVHLAVYSPRSGSVTQYGPPGSAEAQFSPDGKWITYQARRTEGGHRRSTLPWSGRPHPDLQR